MIYNVEHQAKYDKNLKLSEDIEVIPGKKSFSIRYGLNKKILTFDQRDFYEKGFNFCHNNKFYRYSSMIPNSEALKEIPTVPKTVRGETWINCGIIERNPET